MIGYPLRYLAGILDVDETDLNNHLLVLKDHNHIEIEESDSRFIIRIIGWDKYQSEYSRQREYRQVGNANKRARAYSGGKFTSDEWIMLVTLCQNKCICCGSDSSVSDLCPDHVIALSDGGSGDIFNIQPLCGPCNRLKGTSSKDYRTPKLLRELQLKLQPKLHGELLSRSTQEGEGDVEVEVEGEGEEEKNQPPPLAFQGRVLRVTQRQHQRLLEVFGHHGSAYQEADLWLEANPRKVRKNHYAFMRNWLSREKEKAIPSKQEVLVGSGPLERAPRLCARCGATGSWHLNATKRGWPVDHEFAAAVR